MTQSEKRMLQMLKEKKRLTPDMPIGFSQEEFTVASSGLQKKGLAVGLFNDQENGKCVNIVITDIGLKYNL